MLLGRVIGILGLGLCLAVGCERYEAPPEPVIIGNATGVLDDPRAPLVVDFGTAIDPSTLTLSLVFDETNVEGELGDEDTDPQTQLSVILRRDPASNVGLVQAELSADATRIVLTPTAALPVGPKLVLVVEAGLRSTSGRVSIRRVKIPFSYGVKCTGGATRLASGTYFMLLQVKEPIGLQIQILADLTIDPATGALTGRFTSADRKTDLTCPRACPSDTVCRLLPKPNCVAPSEIAGDVEEYPDFAPNPAPPIGYSFVSAGCVSDDASGSGAAIGPATIRIESPSVTAEGLSLTALFTPGADGVVRASGTLTAERIVIGIGADTALLGAGTGVMTARRIP